jgi:pentatricopeptide repeat protein
LRDPRSGYLAAMLAVGYATASYGPSAEGWVELAYELAPDAFSTLWARQAFLMSIRDYPRAIDTAHTALAVSGRQSVVLVGLGTALAESGDVTGARAAYDEMRARGVREFVSPMHLAALAAALGESDAAAAYCHEAFRRRDVALWLTARGHPLMRMSSLRSLPEYRRLMASIGLPGLPVDFDC